MKFYRSVVEDNNNPLKPGAVKVRIFGIHTKNNENSTETFNIVKTADLPWAEVMGSTSFGLVAGVGISSVLKKGTWVWVILNDDNPNFPIVVGTISGHVTEKRLYSDGEGFTDPDGVFPYDARLTEPDFNRLATNTYINDIYYDDVKAYGSNTTIHNTINANLDSVIGTLDADSGADVNQNEPSSTNDLSSYPNVQVLETQSGHVIELDDTATNERIRVYHKSGSYIEIKPDGSFVQKQATAGTRNHYIHTSDVDEHIKAGVKKYIEANLEEIINGEVKRQVKLNLTENILGNVTLKVGGNLTWDVTGNISITSGGTQVITSGGTYGISSGNYSVSAPRIDLNP